MRRVFWLSLVLVGIVWSVVQAGTPTEPAKQPAKQDAVADATAKDVKALQGYWRLKELNINKEKIDVPDYISRMRIEGDKMSPVAADGKDLGKFQTKIKLDATLDPKIIDLTFDTNTLEGIYKFDGKQWIICVSRENVKNRPTEFAPGQDTIFIIFEKEAD